MQKVPKIIHYIWIGANGKPFNVHHMVSIKAVAHYNPGYEIKIHCDEVPTGPYFDKIKDMVTIKFADVPHEVFGVPFLYNPNKATLLRINILLEEGGIYQDLDIITLRSYDDLLDHDVCMGYELSEMMSPRQILGLLKNGRFEVLKFRGRITKGLCNGFLISAKNSQFLQDWLEGFRNYDNKNWGFYSVKMPYALQQSGKYDFQMIPAYQTHFPGCHPDELKLLFEQNILNDSKYTGRYFLHTWESKSFKQYLEPLLDEAKIKSTNSTYCNAIKQFI